MRWIVRKIDVEVKINVVLLSKREKEVDMLLWVSVIVGDST